jgi:hypothetical protein
MSEDPRCCGGGACIIDNQGRCWCGQVWNGREMAHPPLASQTAAPAGADAASPAAGRSADPAAIGSCTYRGKTDVG